MLRRIINCCIIIIIIIILITLLSYNRLKCYTAVNGADLNYKVLDLKLGSGFPNI